MVKNDVVSYKWDYIKDREMVMKKRINRWQ